MRDTMRHMVKPKLIFLDIDGVLNTHDANADQICGIHRDKVELLNTLVQLTGAHVVLSSAWRYMILNGAMTLDGFRYMLVTHGLRSFVHLVGHTKSDEAIEGRGRQIRDYIDALDYNPVYVILDDGSDAAQASGAATLSDSLGKYHGSRWIKVNGATGLTTYEVNLAIHLLA